MTGPSKASFRAQKLTGIALMVLGFLLTVGSVIALVAGVGRELLDGLSGPVHSAPFAAEVQLHSDRRYLLMQADLAGSAARVTADQVQITDPSGHSVTPQDSSGSFQLDRNQVNYTDVVAFHTNIAGPYQIAVPTSAGARLIVVADIGSSFHGVRLKVLGIGLGAATFLAGFIVLLIGFSRQRQTVAGRPVPAAGAGYWQQPPPGWYPDPQSGRPRYWDGYRWQP